MLVKHERAIRVLNQRAKTKEGRSVLHGRRADRTATQLLKYALAKPTRTGYSFYNSTGQRFTFRKATKESKQLWGSTRHVMFKYGEKKLHLLSLQPLPTKFVRTVRWKDSSGNNRKQKITIRFRTAKDMRKLARLQKRGLMPVPTHGRGLLMYDPGTYRLVKADSVRRDSP